MFTNQIKRIQISYQCLNFLPNFFQNLVYTKNVIKSNNLKQLGKILSRRVKNTLLLIYIVFCLEELIQTLLSELSQPASN
jgi:hypothetical protein